jgi:hypothetical protein
MIGFSLVFIYIHILPYYKLFLYFNFCVNVMLDSLSCSFTSISFHYTKTQIKVKEQLVVRKDMDVNEHERQSNITPRHKLK